MEFTIKENFKWITTICYKYGWWRKKLFSWGNIFNNIKEIKIIIRRFYGKTDKQSNITVPTYFNNSQRKATKKADELAGFKSIQILNEPAVVAIAYGYQNKKTKERIMLVFDSGGGTFDVSFVKVNNSVYEVIAINGDNHLGGEDFNNLLADYVINEFYESSGIDI